MPNEGSSFGKKPVRPNRKEIEAYYQSHKHEFYAPERVHVAQIMKSIDEIQSRSEALAGVQEADARLKAGQRFEDVAEMISDCRDGGGELGWFGRGAMVEEFEQVAFTLPVNSVSDIFETRFGFHIVRILAHEQQGTRPLREVYDTIGDLIYRRRLEKTGL